ncbi:hypothetical protein HYZ97_02070 [Candidatus Pacearchaeota archaeon]|nr:hypothetical protein [Candidatus Pacearchaeota archaeon]
MDNERIKHQLKRTQDASDVEGQMEWYEFLLKRYREMPLTLPITDPPMQRICQVLTNQGYTTTDSCEGHGKYLPKIFFQCEDQNHMRDLVYLVNGELHILNHFPWQITAWSSDPYLNPDSKLKYVLEPALWGGQIDANKEHVHLLEDLDFIGLAIIEYFNTPLRFKQVDRATRRMWEKVYGSKE